MDDIFVRAATEHDFEFAFEAKRQALGPHVQARWGWDEALQRDIHRQRWQERSWSIIEISGQPIGTVSVDERGDHIRFGEFYLLKQYQRQGIGTLVLQRVINQSDAVSLPVRLEYLRWNPVASLYRRHGFKPASENDTHYFVERQPSNEAHRHHRQ